MSTGDQNSPAPRAAPKVFISYRRRSDQAYARLLRQDLVREFGDEAVFRDVESIADGDIFPQRIKEAINSCDTFLVLISPDWVETVGGLRDPEDFVRFEIDAALRRGVRVIPILLEGARMPKKEDLPDELQELSLRQARELSDSRWEYDVRNLINAIRTSLVEQPPGRPPLPPPPVFFLFDTWRGRAASLALLLAVWFLFWYFAPAPSVVVGTGDNVNVTTTPLPTQTPTPTRTPATTPTPRTQCFREVLPEGRWVGINYGDPDERVVIRRDQPKDESAGILLTSQGREVGAIRFRFIRYGKDAAGNDSGYYEIEQAVGPDCRPVEGYSQPPGGGGPAGRRNYEWLEQIPLGGGRYDLRIAYANEAIVAVFKRKPY